MAQRFEEHRTRILQALGDVALQVDHVGWRSVPGPAAKPVIDVQVVVADVEREQDWLPALEDVKRSLAGREWPDMNHYAAAKTDVVREVVAAD